MVRTIAKIIELLRGYQILSFTIDLSPYNLLQPFSLILQFNPFLILFLRILLLSFIIDLSFLLFTLNLQMPFTLDFCLYPLLYQSFPYPSLQSFPIPFTLVLSHTIYSSPFALSFTLVLSIPFTLNLSLYSLLQSFSFS